MFGDSSAHATPRRSRKGSIYTAAQSAKGDQSQDIFTSKSFVSNFQFLSSNLPGLKKTTSHKSHSPSTQHMCIHKMSHTVQTSPRPSSVTLPERPETLRHDSTSRKSPTSALMAALKKPFQGWSRELMRARDHDDDDYNFAGGRRRGVEDYRSEQ